jgi:hypothetical protein
VESLQLPDDLIAFLDSGGRLEYDPATCEAGEVTLLPLSALRLRTFTARGGPAHQTGDPNFGRGVYRVSGVDLIATCTGDYEPEGLLLWLPGERSFGVWDPSHDYLMVFGMEVSWSQIVKSPARYINAQWGFEDLDRAPAEFLCPWIGDSLAE